MKKGMLRGKKGLSEVVTTLLFVLLALGAVLLVWFVVKGLISSGSTSVNLEQACLNLDLQVKSCSINASSTGMVVAYQRGNTNLPDGFTFDKTDLIFEFATGETKAVVNKGVLPGVLESKIENITIGIQGLSTPGDLSAAPVRVGVSGVILANGKDSSCAESAAVTCSLKTS